MELIWRSAYLLLSFLMGFWVYLVTSSLAAVRKKWWAHFFLYTACYFLCAMVIFIGDLANLPPTLAAYLTAVWVCCDGSKIKRLTIALMIASTVFSFNALNDNFIWRHGEVCRQCAKAVFTFVFYLGTRSFSPDEEYELSPSMWRLLLLLTAMPIGIVLSVVLLSPGNYRFPDYKKIYITLLIISLMSFFSLMWTVTVLAKQRKLEQQSMFAEINQRYYETMEQQHFQIRRLKHDLANHLQTLSMLSDDKRDAYIQNLLQHSSVSRTLNYCGDSTVNAVLTVKENVMRRANISFEKKLEISSELPLEKADICAVLANALDNAIEACSSLDETEKRIILKAYAKKGLFVLSIKNPCGNLQRTTGKEYDDGFFPRTTKKDKENHGYGLRSIEEIVKRCQGKLELKTEDGEFELFLYIPVTRLQAT